MDPVHIRFSEILPYVRYVQRFFVSDDAYPEFFRAYDNRIFYVHQGSGTIYFADRTHRLAPGDLILWLAGVEYRMISDDGATLVLLGSNFDFTQSSNHISYPVPPVGKDLFDPAQVLDAARFLDNTPFNDIIYLKNMFRLEADFLEMLQEYDVQKVFCAERLSCLLKSILCLACRSVSLRMGGSPDPDSTERVDEVIQFIQTHYAEELTNESIGQRFHYHPNYLNKLMKLYTGKSLHQYLISYRIARAVDLLSTTDLPVAAVADQVGFHDLCHFGKLFHARLGVAPSLIRNPCVVSAARQIAADAAAESR